ncbi:recQ-mediated genome instability protein 2-like [Thalassophryne amazonica]|uniref:recQ-mediated genome instability protein 2-like n=1 Tax=Thalassophryne amazonica TaxID=390379 RepID=UPI0014724019|nr:recQ-mediated genome instability protein 2-like [Thalassophryne amazonica]XP_034046310.1 recQ-mediated genome instability protein 2-like [Thalassophryne amazonica]
MNTGEKTTRPPPVKVLSGQLRTAESQRSADGRLECVLRPGRARSLPVSMVWMQGTVLEVQLHRDTVLLMDETGTFVVQGINTIPKGKPCLSPGSYMMVMGVIRAASPEPVIQAVKMADLSELTTLHRRMWKLEVEDLQEVLLT